MKELDEMELRDVEGGFFPAIILIGWEQCWYVMQ